MGHFSLKSEVKHKKIAKELEMILDNIPGLVFYKDTKNNFIKVNKYVADAYKMTKRELEGKSLFDLYPKDQAQAYWDDDLDVIKSGKPKLNIEEPWEIKEGIRWVNTNKIPYIDENGEIKGIIGFSLDITEHKKEEVKRQESEENFRALTENANDGILIIDGKGEFIYVNRRMSEITGYNIEELLKFKIKDLTHPDEYNKIYERFRSRLEGKPVPNQYESVIVNKEGKSVMVEVTAAMTIWKNQPADLVIFRDITTRKKSEKELIKHRKRLEELVEERTERLKTINEQLKQEITEHKKVELALKESEELYKSLVRTSPDAIIVSDLKGKVIEMSKRALELSGFESIEDIIGKSAFDFIAPEDHEKAAKNLQKTFKNGILENAEYKILRKDGTYYIGELNASLIKDIHGKPKSFLATIRDTTEKKKIEKELKESEEWLSTTLRSIGDAVIAFDTKSNVTFLNPVAESLTGWKQEEAIEKPLEEIFNIINEETRKPVENPVSRVLREGRIIGLANHTILIAKNGNEITIADSGAPIKDDKGNIIGVVLVFRDITERKKAEEELIKYRKHLEELVEERTEGLKMINQQLKQEITERKKAEERFSNFKKLAPDAFFLYDSEFNLVDINDAGLELLPGVFKKEEVIGKEITELIPNIKETDRYEKYEEVLKTGKLFSREEIEVHPKFGDIYLSMRAFKVGNDLGVILSDITSRKKAEQEVFRQKTILEAINKVFQKAITCVIEEEKVRTWIEVAQELSGAKFGFFGEVNQEGKFDTLAISNPGWDECKMPGSEATKLIKGMEIRGMQFLPLIDGKSLIINDPSNHPDSAGTPDGHPKITCLLAVPFKHKDKIIGQIGLGNKPGGFNENDKNAIELLSIAIVQALIKQRAEEKIKKSEETLRVSNENLKKIMEELKRSNAELEQFAYVASHDLQEPLRMVASFTQLLQNRYQDKLDDDANDFINYAVNGATRMQNLINDLLTFSRVGTRGKPLKKVDMNVVLENVIVNFKPLIEETNTTITYNPLPVIIADESQMMQLLQNLISNAIKFCSEESPRIQVSGEIKADKWVFSVRDNGIGIDSKYFDRIFIIFQRLHKKNEYGGTGIGLAVCKKIIQRHRGKIWVESEQGKGSTFYFSIQKEKIGQSYES